MDLNQVEYEELFSISDALVIKKVSESSILLFRKTSAKTILIFATFQ